MRDRLLAESLRALEADGRKPVADDAGATAVGHGSAGDLEAKIIARARATHVCSELERAVGRLERAARALAVVLLTLVLLLGAGAARAALGLGVDSRVNFFHALGTLLGIQTIVLLVWLVLILWHPASISSFSLGALLRWLVDLIMRRRKGSKAHVAAVEGATVVYAHPKLAKWMLSSLSHAAWLAFNVGCIAMLLLLLSTRFYSFVWETTILSDEAYAPLVESIAALPKLAGFESPTAEQVAASEWTGATHGRANSDATLSRAWSGLLVGAIVVYGALPRGLLLPFCLWQWNAARRRYRLDLNRPGFAILAARLEPTQKRIGVVDPEGEQAYAHEPPRLQQPRGRPAGPAAVIGIEIDPPRIWPPKLDGTKLADFGIVRDRVDRHRALQQLASSANEPAALLIVCSLTSTPDRGMASTIAQLQNAVTQPIHLLLTGGHTMRQRSGVEAITHRLEDWRTLAAQLGLSNESILEIDLDHATHTTLAQLAAHIQGDVSKFNSVRRIDAAFALIVEHAEAWKFPPSHRQQATLHQAILRLYGDAGSPWRSLIAEPPTLRELTIDAAKALRVQSDRAVSLLPPQLRIRPKWVVAGATAGAVGCIAAAALAAPAVIGAIPIWTALGATIASAVSTIVGKHEDMETDASRESTLETAVRAAALNVLLFESQGDGEAAISRLLERTLAGFDVDARITSADDVRMWLGELRHRYDIAIAQERGQ